MLSLIAVILFGLQSTQVVVLVRAEGKPVSGVEVAIGEKRATTNATGEAAFEIPPGAYVAVVKSAAHLPWESKIDVAAGAVTRVTADLEPLPEIEDEIEVSATRSATRLRDQALRVEVIDREEIEEKALMTPGSVAMLLGETSGLRVQTTAPSLGAANVRIQGLRGRYAQMLADGLPLYGAQGDSFSMLQVPPLDLGQVEVIKGVASALYGASALGGVINLVSRRPQEVERELLFNQTTQAGTDVTAWLAQPGAGRWSYTLLGGYHTQQRKDLDDDGWTDLPSYDRGLLRPRVFYDNREGRTLFVTAGVMAEDRRGGTLSGRTAPDGRPFREALNTRHADSGAMARWLTASGRVFALRGSFMRQTRDRDFGGVRERGARMTYFGEASLTGSRGRHTWVAGAAFQQDRFDLRELPQFDYRFSTPSLFAQDEIAVSPLVSIAASARADFHSEYGALATPRVSVLMRPNRSWTIRSSVGTGAFTPTPFTEETDETGLSRVQPLRDLDAERAVGGSVDVTRRLGPFELTGTLFASRVAHAVQSREISGTEVRLVNAGAATRTWGSEIIARYRIEGFTAGATHAWTRATEPDPDTAIRRDVPLTAEHAASFNAIREGEGGRVGVEVYYTGRQPLEDNPYRGRGRPYWLAGFFGERRVGRFRVFLNLENLFDIRQTKDDPLTLPARLPDGRWTVDAWAPLDGRVINGGIRVSIR
ncbi:MAG TPA: TonB-dependent receptor [Vicinamibacterales bacterium]|nr:TonB-dependent receptor [Vicinamibacterales bacterium]